MSSLEEDTNNNSDNDTNTNDNVGIALGLVIAAGASTGLGAAVVFVPSLIKLASRRVLASALGFSAGVMTYVSFVEIFNKATSGFEDAGHEPNIAYMYSTVCFFGGVVTMILLNLLVSKMLGGHSHRHREDGADHEYNSTNRSKHATRKSLDEKISKMAATAAVTSDKDHRGHDVVDHGDYEPTNEPAQYVSDPVSQLNTLQQMGSVLIHEHEQQQQQQEEEEEQEQSAVIGVSVETKLTEQKENAKKQQQHDEEPMPITKQTSDSILPQQKMDDDEEELHHYHQEDHQEKQQQQETAAAAAESESESDPNNRKLVKMGLNTALAIGLHNFPEGLATFVAALEDPKVGAVLAVAIAIHNIPEGLCVALPIYYATGNRLRAFLWALLSGASEFIAALLGWAILANAFTDTAYATLFGLVAGMMVIISIRELLPTAHFYDPEDTVVTYSYIGGMMLMALSLVLFQI